MCFLHRGVQNSQVNSCHHTTAAITRHMTTNATSTATTRRKVPSERVGATRNARAMSSGVSRRLTRAVFVSRYRVARKIARQNCTCGSRVVSHAAFPLRVQDTSFRVHNIGPSVTFEAVGRHYEQPSHRMCKVHAKPNEGRRRLPFLGVQCRLVLPGVPGHPGSSCGRGVSREVRHARSPAARRTGNPLNGGRD